MFAGKYSSQDYDDYTVVVAVWTLLRAFSGSKFQGIYSHYMIVVKIGQIFKPRTGIHVFLDKFIEISLLKIC
jgi:hypothetical protein